MHNRLWLEAFLVSMFVVFGAVMTPARSATIVEPGDENRVIKEVDDFALKDSQINHKTFSNDKWNSGLIDLDGIYTLKTGATFQLILAFDKGLKLDDGFFDGNESFHLDVQGVGGVGGAPNNKADFVLRLPQSFGGPLLFNPTHTGTVGQNALNGEVDFDESFNMILGGDVTLTHVNLKLTNKNPNDWNIGKIGVGFDADDIKVVKSPLSVIDLKIEQQVLRRQLVATIKLAYCQSASPTQARCRA